MSNLTDIVQGCLRADRRFQKELYERYYGYALKVVFRYIYQYDKAVDVVNDGYIKVFRHFGRFTAEPYEMEMLMMAWIKRIMINTAIDQLRKDTGQIEMKVLPDNIWDQHDSSTASDNLMYKELIGYVKQLPPAYRMVFNLFVIDGYTHHEISNLLKINIGTSKSNLAKARVYLQNLLKKEMTVKNVAQ